MPPTRFVIAPRIPFLALVSVLALMACQPPPAPAPPLPASVGAAIEPRRLESVYRLLARTDSLTGARSRELAFNRLAAPDDAAFREELEDGSVLVWGLEQVHLTARHRRTADGGESYELEVQYRGEKALDIAAGATLTLFFGDAALELEGPGSAGRRRRHTEPYRAPVEERAAYAVSRGLLRDLTGGDTAWLALQGRERRLERACTAHNLALLRRFVDETSTLLARVTRTSDLGGPSIMVYLDMGRAQGLRRGARGLSAAGAEAEIRSLQPDWSIAAVPRRTPVAAGDTLRFILSR